MPRNFSRRERVSDLIQTALAGILQKDFKDLLQTMVTVTSVDVSHDLSFAKVYVSVLDDAKSKETVALLNQEVKHIRYLLAQAVELRIAPQLKFIYDDSAARGYQISALLDEALKEKK